MSLLKVSDNYSANIVGNFSAEATTLTVDVAPVKTAGYLTAFDFNGNQYEKIKYTGVSGLNLTGCIRGLSDDDNSDTPVSGNAKELKNGMGIKMTVTQHYLNPIIDVINGTNPSEGVMKNPTSRVINDSRHLVDKEYADEIVSSQITSLKVTSDGDLTVAVNSGYYSLNGVVSYYTGSAANALTDDAVNYIQLNDSVLEINTSAFSEGAMPLAKFTTASGAISIAEDARALLGWLDIKTANGIGRDANGIFIDLADEAGLEIAEGKLKAKLKSGGGLIIDADGLSVEASLQNATLPAYESLVAGDLLKVINDSGTYKLKKIVGIGAEMSGSISPYTPSESLMFEFISANKIAVFFQDMNNYFIVIGTISGTTITFGTVQAVKATTNVTNPTLSIKKISDDNFILVYPYNNASNSSSVFAIACSVSGTVLTFGTETQIYQVGVPADIYVAEICEIDTSKFAVAYVYNNVTYCNIISIDGSLGITVGAQKNLSGGQSYSYPRLAKLKTNEFVVFYYDLTNNDTVYKVCTVSVLTITDGAQGTFLTRGGSNYLGDSYVIAPTGEDAGIIAWVEANSVTTLRFATWSRSGDVISLSGSTYLTSTFTLVFTINTGNIIVLDNYVYFYKRSVNLKKFSFDSNGNFVLFNTYSVHGYGSGSNYLVKRDDDIVILNDYNGSDVLHFKPLLLDHDEFITSANSAYNAEDEVPIVSRYTGFSNLLAGLDYYINESASDLTIVSTYQKVGKAINATTIIK